MKEAEHLPLFSSAFRPFFAAAVAVTAQISANFFGGQLFAESH